MVRVPKVPRLPRMSAQVPGLVQAPVDRSEGLQTHHNHLRLPLRAACASAPPHDRLLAMHLCIRCITWSCTCPLLRATFWPSSVALSSSPAATSPCSSSSPRRSNSGCASVCAPHAQAFLTHQHANSACSSTILLHSYLPDSREAIPALLTSAHNKPWAAA